MIDLSSFKGIIFDMDGTLVDSMGRHINAWQVTCEVFGYPFDADYIHSLGGVPTLETVEMLNAKYNIQNDVEEVAGFKKRASEKLPDIPMLIPDTLAVFNHYIKSHPISVAVMSLGLFACAINVTPSAFFHQDNQIKPLTTTKLHAAIEQDQTSAGITRVEIDNDQGLTLRGVAVSYAEPVVNIVFYADNRMPVSENNSVLHRLGKIPANILWMDYQGVGASDKSEKLSINAIKADALTVFDYAEGIFDKSLPTIVHGRGVGSYFASYVAANKPIDGLVLDGAFNNISDLIANMVPGFSNSLTSMKLHPEVHLMQIAPILRHYEGPLWLLVGEKDVITPFEISKQLLATAASDAKYISVVPGATHNATLKHDFAIEEYQRFISHIRP